MRVVRDIGEFGLIKRLTKLLPTSEKMGTVPSERDGTVPGFPADVLEGIGDDCAVLRIGGRVVLASCDLFIENVHFRRTTASPEDIGWKAAAAALSDIAAMGGTPLYCLVALACPAETELTAIDALYRGLAEAVAHAGAAVIGGDTTRSPEGIVLDISVIGEAREGRYLSRKGAQTGDVLAVTGHVGLSAAGLHAIERDADAPTLAQAHRRPKPRYPQGQWLCRQDNVHAMIDVSDGLIQDAGHLADAAQLGVDIDPRQLPVEPNLARYCEKNGLDTTDFMLTGGEDYELALAIAPEAHKEMAGAFLKECNTSLTAIATFTDQWPGVRAAGKEPPPGGYNHFA